MTFTAMTRLKVEENKKKKEKNVGEDIVKKSARKKPNYQEGAHSYVDILEEWARIVRARVGIDVRVRDMKKEVFSCRMCWDGSYSGRCLIHWSMITVLGH